ncbi:MAG TPA: GNAT family N-acetyltransferase [Bacteroidia bacterium]
MQTNIHTSRLSLSALGLHDSSFIMELVNTDGWKQFIGERNVNSITDSEKYIQKILDSKTVQYWVVRLKETNTSIGIVTLIKRDYLDHHDIGFAFLPGYGKAGYALEAATTVLEMLMELPQYQVIHATTLPDNVRSITLLEKLGLKLEKKIEVEKELLLLYTITK